MSANEECRGGARRLRRSRLPLLLALCALVAASAGSVRAQDEPPVEPPPEFDLGDLPDFFDADPIAEEPRLTIHGTIDLTLILFDSEENLDGFPEDRLTLLEPRISLAYDWTDRTRLLAEIEVDGLDWELEVEQLNLRHSLDDHLDVTAGVFYVPFGIERHYYAPATNPLVDRPSPFRRVFPGTYADLGLHLHYERPVPEGWSMVVEGAVTRALEGPTRDDRPKFSDDIDTVAPSGRLGFIAPGGLRFGTSALTARYDDGVGGHEDLRLHGVDLSLHHGLWIFRAEAIWGRVGRAASAGGDFDRYGWYAELYRRFPNLPPWGRAFEGVVRFDDVEVDDSVRDAQDVRRFAFGWNWVFDDHWRLKTEFLVSREDGESVANDGRFIQLEVHF